VRTHKSAGQRSLAFLHAKNVEDIHGKRSPPTRTQWRQIRFSLLVAAPFAQLAAEGIFWNGFPVVNRQYDAQQQQRNDAAAFGAVMSGEALARLCHCFIYFLEAPLPTW